MGLKTLVQLWLSAIRESFVLMLPLAMLGALALLAANVPADIYHYLLGIELSTTWLTLNQYLWQATYGIMASVLCALTGFRLARKRQDKHQLEFHPLIIAVMCVISFYLLNFLQFNAAFSSGLGAAGVFKAIVIAIACAEFFTLCNRYPIFRLPGLQADFDHLLHQSLNAILPSFILILLLVAAQMLLSSLSFSFTQSMQEINSALLRFSGSTLPQTMLYSLLNQSLWFMGIHGANVLESLSESLFGPVIGQNLCMAPEFSRDALNIFVHIGGSGSTLGLLLAILWHSRQGESARVAKYAMLPALFNINELVLFGLPVVLNPVYFLPFILAPLSQILFTYLALQSGWLTLTSSDIAWSTPPLISGYLYTQAGLGALWQAGLILLSTLIYLPFVKRAEIQRHNENQAEFQHMITLIEENHTQQHKVSKRLDRVGLFARQLIQDFNQDLGTARVYLQYQPKVDVHGYINGVEALIRWQHPLFGSVPAHALVSLCEEGHEIHQLGREVFRIACATQAHWQAQGINICMAVNLSPLQLSDSGLPDFIKEQLEKYALNPATLELELTEGQAIKSSAEETQMLQNIMALGINMAIDDFGMGYTSMRYLMHFKANTIKLDGSLTCDVEHNAEARNIIESISFLSQRQNMQLVAEFVETTGQRKILQALGCDSFQGYLYSKPLDADKCLALLQHNQQHPFNMHN